MDEETWISLHRKLKNWEWYKDINTKTLFLHLLLVANYKDNLWKGILVKRGQRLTSLGNLADETGLTIQQTRTAIKRLKSTGEITVETTSKYSLITIEKYDFYQKNNSKVTKKITSEITINQQATNKQVTTNNKDNNIIFNLLLNKYKQNFPQTYNQKIQRIAEIKNSDDYQRLTIDEQDRLFNKLMIMRRSDL